MHISLTSKAGSGLKVFGNLAHYVLKPVQIESVDSGYFSETQNSVTLRNLLSSEKNIRRVLKILDNSLGEENILTTFRLLTSLSRQTSPFLAQIQSICSEKLLEMHPEGVSKLMGYLLDFSLGRVDAHLTVDPNEEKLAVAVPELLIPQMLELPLSLLSQISSEKGA